MLSDASHDTGVRFTGTILRDAASEMIAGPVKARSPLTAPIAAEHP
jgi:hypothetical protein